MISMTLRLPDELHESLRQQAFAERTSITALILAAIGNGRPKPGTLCDWRNCVQAPVGITTPGGFHFCALHMPESQSPDAVAARRLAYQNGAWCGECRYGVVEDPPCCTQPSEPESTT